MAEVTLDLDERKTTTKLHYAVQERLPMWTVYRPTTKDHFGKWLARMHFTLPECAPTNAVVFGATLEEVRAKLPHGLVMLMRQPDDDPVIEEVWL